MNSIKPKRLSFENTWWLINCLKSTSNIILYRCVVQNSGPPIATDNSLKLLVIWSEKSVIPNDAWKLLLKPTLPCLIPNSVEMMSPQGFYSRSISGKNTHQKWNIPKNGHFSSRFATFFNKLSSYGSLHSLGFRGCNLMKVLQKLHSFRKVSAFLGGKKTVKKEVNLDFFFSWCIMV